MTATDDGYHPPPFLLTPAFQELSCRSFEIHAASPDVSPEAYLADKHLKHQMELANKTLIYLDTCHWINLRHIVTGYARAKAGYREILGLLGDLYNRGQVCCPISFLLFMELMKQTDPVTRLQTAKLMDRFSDGVCFRFPLEMARLELRHFLLKGLDPNVSTPTPWVLTKIGFLGGEKLPSHPALTDEDDRTMQKTWIDLMWAVGLEEKLDMVGSLDHGMDYWAHYATASNTDAVFYRSSRLPYQKVLEREKALLIRRLLADELETVGQEVWNRYPECRDPSKRREPSPEDYSPWNFPSLQTLAGINAADMMTNKKFSANDMLDYRHAALAIPYCDAVFVDNPMAARLRNKPCEFGGVYGTEILGRPEAILEYLKQLT